MEEWKEIPVFGGRFLVSNLGRVKQSIRYDSRGRKAGGRILCLNKRDKDGYCIVQVQHRGEKKYLRVHRLVAEAFIPNPENKPQIDHINAIKDDNRAENLRWATPKENNNNPISVENNRRAQTGKKMSAESSRKKRDAMPKKPVVQYTVDGAFVARFDAIADAARAIGDNGASGSISNCCKGNNKTARGYVWRYEIC